VLDYPNDGTDAGFPFDRRVLARVHHGLSARIAIRSEFAVFEGSDRMKMLEMRGFDGFSEM